MDLFRVVGGSEHLYTLNSHFAELTTSGLDLDATDDMAPTWQMRDYRVDTDPSVGWHAMFSVEDRYELLNGAPAPCLRYTGLTEDAEVLTAEGWVALSGSDWRVGETWIPRLLVRRAGANLKSAFVGVIEPYVGAPRVTSARRLGIAPRNGSAPADADIALEVTLDDGRRDVIVALDADARPWGADAAPVTASVPEAGIEIAARLGFVRYGADGAVEHAAAWHGQSLQAGEWRLDIPAGASFAETDDGA